MVRGSMIEELSSDYVRTARAKGITELSVLFRHAFPNALIPVITIIGLRLVRCWQADHYGIDFFLARHWTARCAAIARGLPVCCRAAFL